MPDDGSDRTLGRGGSQMSGRARIRALPLWRTRGRRSTRAAAARRRRGAAAPQNAPLASWPWVDGPVTGGLRGVWGCHGQENVRRTFAGSAVHPRGGMSLRGASGHAQSACYHPKIGAPLNRASRLRGALCYGAV